jgi:hypothetical protein
MHITFLLGILLTTACIGPNARVGAATGDVTVSLARTTAEARPVLIVTMNNSSQAEVCVRAELLQNPYSYAMDLRLRDSRGREVKREKPGYLSPPILEAVRIAPGQSVQGRFYLDARFKLKGDAGQLLPDMSVQATFRYDACDGSQSQQAVSAWQRI